MGARFALGVVLGGAVFCNACAPGRELERPGPLRPGGTTEIPLFPFIQVLEDPTGRLTFDEARVALRAGLGRGNWRANPTFGASDSAFWVRFEIAPSDRNGRWFLVAGLPRLQSVRLYEPGGRVKNSGLAVGLADRPYPHAQIIFPLSPESPGEYLMRIQSATSFLQLPLTLYSGEGLAEFLEHGLLINGLYLGLGIGLLGYNLILLVLLRSRSLLLYVLVLASFLMIQMSLRGFGVQYLWESDSAFNYFSVSLFIYLSFLLMSLFARDFLEIDRRHGFWNGLLLVLAAVQVVLILVTLVQALVIETPILQKWIAPMAILYPLLFFAAGLRRLKDGFRPAFLFVLAWIALAAGVSLSGLEALGFVPISNLTRDGMLLGSALQMVLHSVGLAHRFREAEIAREHLVATVRARQTFLGTMSHEMRTPLTAIIGLGDVLEDSNLDQQQREYLATIQESGRHLLFLVNDLLDLSRIEAGKMSFNPVPFAPRNLLEELVKLLKVQAEQKGLPLLADVSGVPPEIVIGDPDRLRQILINLIGNAIKFTARGEVRVRAGLRLADRIATLACAIEDTGPGIPASLRDVIFEPFHQVVNTMGSRGAGLGLSISRNLVRMMNGEIQLESKEGSGTTFSITIPFPLAEQATAHSDPAGAAAVPGENRLSILVVEDDPAIRMILEAFLKPTAHAIEFLENGQEAVERFKQTNFDLILMDRRLPGLDGLTAVRQMRAWEAQALREGRRMSRVRIVAQSADASPGDIAQSLAAGCDGHLAKPIRKTEFLAFVSEVARGVPVPPLTR